jgi:hypothetical protein
MHQAFEPIEDDVRPAPDFKQDFRRANCCSMLFYNFLTPILGLVRDQKGKLTDS